MKGIEEKKNQTAQRTVKVFYVRLTSSQFGRNSEYCLLFLQGKEHHKLGQASAKCARGLLVFVRGLAGQMEQSIIILSCACAVSCL